MKGIAAFTLLAAASANVIPQSSVTTTLYPLTTIATIGSGTGFFYGTSSTAAIPTSYPTNVGTGSPSPTNGTYNPTGTVPQPSGGYSAPPSPTTSIPISGASANSIGLLALAGAAAAYIVA